MPIYEYQCQDCQREFEELVRDERPVPCPACGSTNTEKLMSCCRFKTAGAGAMPFTPQAAPPRASAAGGGCAGCSGGSCATCK